MDSVGVCVLHIVREVDTFSYGGRKGGEGRNKEKRERGGN